ncbi:MAG: NAD(P)H-dependent oxidoreductase subunit E [Pseudomonadota bacterium]
MARQHDPAIAHEIIASFGARPEQLVQILNAFVERYSFISDSLIAQLAEELNVSRADVLGVVSFYHDFRRKPAGRYVVRICQGEACQAMGSRSLTQHAEDALNVTLNASSQNGQFTLEPVYCLGNCACSPAVMIDDRVYGRVSSERFDALCGELTEETEA